MHRLAVRPDLRSKRLRALLAIIASTVVLSTASLHAEEEPETSTEARESPATSQPSGETEEQGSSEEQLERTEIPYEVEFEGTKEETLELVQQVSETLRLLDRPPTSISRLRRRAEGDLPRILKAMQARAHYAAKVEFEIDEATSPITVTFKIDAGQSYDINKVVFELDPPSEDDLDLPKPKDIGLVTDKRASSIKIVEAESRLLNRIKNQGFAHAKLGKRRLVVDHNNQKMDITLRLAPGRKVYFGETHITGNQDVETRFIRRRLAWKAGELVTPERLNETESDLIESELFNSVRVELGNEVDADGRLPVNIKVSEGKHRSIEAGVRYRTDEGLGGSLGWKHRNLLGTGEQLGFELDGSKFGWSLNAQAREPDFLRRRQTLVLGTEIEMETTDAFDSESVSAYVGIERSVGKNMELGLGVAFTASKVEQSNDVDRFDLLSLPAGFRWDHSNDLLDPSRGGRLYLKNEPFVDIVDQDVAFDKASIAYSRYFRLKRAKPRLILALRGKFGSIVGAEREDIPADERFYAGGGGSIRGYGYQLAGELDDNDDPVGGRSLLEFAGELRGNITDSIGAVLFVDSGAAYSSTVPDFDEPINVGVGTGLRYFSPIGPIRFDVGIPLDRRDSDDAFQIYVSVGQAF